MKENGTEKFPVPSRPQASCARNVPCCLGKYVCSLSRTRTDLATWALERVLNFKISKKTKWILHHFHVNCHCFAAGCNRMFVNYTRAPIALFAKLTQFSPGANLYTRFSSVSCCPQSAFPPSVINLSNKSHIVNRGSIIKAIDGAVAWRPPLAAGLPKNVPFPHWQQQLLTFVDGSAFEIGPIRWTEPTIIQQIVLRFPILPVPLLLGWCMIYGPQPPCNRWTCLGN